MRQYADIMIIGTGISGVSAAFAARNAAPQARVLLVGEEPGLPYKRTSLSKHLADPEILDHTLPQFASGQPLPFTLRSGTEIVSLDGQTRTMTAINGNTISAGAVILATGSLPRQPRCGWGRSILGFRTQADALAVRTLLRESRTVLIGGSGVLAVELACQAAASGTTVTMAGRNRQILARHFDAESATWLEALLADHGIRFLPEVDIDEISVSEGRPFLERVPAGFDGAIIAAGTTPATALAVTAGIEPDPGIPVDGYSRTGLPGIFAAGDCSSRNGFMTSLWHQAQAQGQNAGTNAAAFLAGAPLVPYSVEPQRVKCRIFDCFTWSCNHACEHDTVESIEKGRIVLRLLFKDGGLVGASAIGIDEALDKPLSRAVSGHWPIDRVRGEILAGG